MKIIKATKDKDWHIRLCVDEVPEITYEKIGMDYVGSDEDGFFSHHLRYERAGSYFKAFGGREIPIKMKDGSTKILKDYWWDNGHYNKHGNFISIGLGTSEELQDCYVYFSSHIQEDKLKELVIDYLSRDKFYEYYEIEKWLKLQYTWYPLIVHGKEIPFMMNKKGDIVDMYTKEPKYCMINVIKSKLSHNKIFRFFKIQYHDGNRLVKLEDMYSNVCKNTLPKEDYEALQEKYSKDIW